MNWREKGIRLRTAREPVWDEGFVGLAMTLALVQEGEKTEDTGERWRAVVPQGYGRMKKVEAHRLELEEMERGNEDKPEKRSTSAIRTRKSPTPSPHTPSSPFLRTSSRFPIPVHYLSRHQHHIPGLVRIKKDSDSQVSLAQSFRYATPSGTSRHRDLSKSPRPQILLPAPLSPLRVSVETTVSQPPHTGIKSYDGTCKGGTRHGQGTAEYWNGEKYEGGWVQGMREGTGTWSGKEGVYVGEWKKDKKHGAGVITFPNGDTLQAIWHNGVITSDPVVFTLSSQSSKYKGTLLCCQLSGHGTMEYKADNVAYTGVWKQGNRHGYGVLVFKDGSFFEGGFESDYTVGAGLLVLRKAITFKTDYKSSSSSERLQRPVKISESDNPVVNPSERTSALGDFSRYQYFFKETEFFSHDVLFKSLSLLELSSSGYSYPVSPGSFSAGKLTGAGLALYGASAVYHGSFKEGHKCGFGCMVYTNIGYSCVGLPEAEGKYIGEWRGDKRHGKGRMEWTSGAVYEGQFREDQRHFVTGTMQFLNGDRYEGAWMRNLMHGQGTYTTADNYQFKGLFSHGHISSEGHLLCPNGVRYEGEVRDLKPTGQGRMHYPNGSVYEGEVLRGVRMGEGRMEYENGDWYQGEWREDWRDGVGVMYYRDRKEMYEGSWRRNKRSGQGKLVNHKKEVLYEGMWRDDVMEGKGVLTDHLTA